MSVLIDLLALSAAACFIFALKFLSDPKTAVRGNNVGIAGMTLAIISACCHPAVANYFVIILGILIGAGIGIAVTKKISMTALPQLVAGFHSLVGLAAVLVALSAFYAPIVFKIGSESQIMLSSLAEMGIGAAIGAITFTGSLVAFGKLQGLLPSKPILLPERHIINLALVLLVVFLICIFVATSSGFSLWLVILASFALGVLGIIPIGGADMPVVISMLNSYSGWAACGIGFTLHNTLLIITGALVGSSGAILSYIMCRGMNRSIVKVILGGFGEKPHASTEKPKSQGAKSASSTNSSVKDVDAKHAADMLKKASSVIIVPGYGMAVAQAQRATKDLVDKLKDNGSTVKFAIHPVAGRMPGHMNVLLAEANIPYDDVYEFDDINDEFKETDVALVVGANDVTNPAAKTDKTSPIYGMPVFDVEDAKSVLFIKRSMAPGYSGVENSLFHMKNTRMIFGDAKKVLEDIAREL